MKYIKPQNKNINICQGLFPVSLTDNHYELKFAFVHIDADLYKPIFDGLEFFYPRLSQGGFI